MRMIIASQFKNVDEKSFFTRHQFENECGIIYRVEREYVEERYGEVENEA